MEFEEHEDQDEEMEIPDQPPLQQQPPQQQPTYDHPSATDSSASARKPPSSSSSAMVRYRECQKNHAVGIGGSAVDGCGEFLAAGEEGTLDALRCAACNCHRNFHRKETADSSFASAIIYHPHQQPPPHLQHHHFGQPPHHQFSPYYRAAPAPSGYLQLTAGPSSMQRQLALPPAVGATSSREDAEDYVSNNPGSSGGGSGSMKKRFRTKFTQEQKERMLVFAERLGWRIQKHDDVAVEQFCAETGVRRHVLKVWMHNNKHTLGKKP